MNKQIDTIKKTRIFTVDLIKALSVEELNEIPPGFNNNIVWNLAHLLAAQQGVCYLRAGLQPRVDEKYITTYKSGTKPEQFVDEAELSEIKDVLLTSLDQLETDYENNIFSHYNAWTTRYGVELTTIEDAIGFLGFHEGLHNGYITALKRLVKK